MASLAVIAKYARASERPARGANDLIDARALAAELAKLAKEHAGNERELRARWPNGSRPRSPTAAPRPSSCC